MKTFMPKNPGQDRDWLVVDATDKPVGRLAVEIANLLRGRDKPTYTPHIDTGCFVIVTNAEKVKLSGTKEEKKIYQRYTGYRGGLREVTAAVMRTKKPEYIVKHAVKGMLPGNNLARQMYRRLKVYAGSEHPHVAQNPRAVELI